MTSPRALVRRALAGEDLPHYPCGPLAVHNTAVLAGVAIEEYTLDPDVMAGCIARYYERFKPEAVWVSADTWITAGAMGVPTAFPGDNQPMAGTGRPFVQTAADIDAIPPADPFSQGRMPIMLEALEKVRARLGSEVFIVGCFDQSPFSLACAVGGMQNVMMQMLTDRPLVDALLERCIEYAAAYANALGAAGADLLSTGDSPAGLIGAERYRDIALPAEQRVFNAIRAGCGVPASLHICGNSLPILEDMARSGAAVLEIDHQVPFEEACRRVPDEIALWGNLDPVGVLDRGTPDEVAAAVRVLAGTARRHGRNRFVISSGCTLAPGTPPENIEAMIRAARGA